VSSSLRRGALAATVLAFASVTLAACGAGTDAQTLEVHPDVAATAVGDIKIQNATVITEPDLKAKGPAVISATIFNNGRTDQVLKSVKLSNSGATARLKPAKGNGPLVIPAEGSVLIGGKGNPSAVLANGRKSVTDGNVQPVTFTFSKTGDVKLDTYVTPATSYFGAYGPSSVPSPTTSPSGSPSGSASPGGKTPGGKASGSPSGGPSSGTSTSPAGGASAPASSTGASTTGR
jgi:hypothetical protein